MVYALPISPFSRTVVSFQPATRRTAPSSKPVVAPKKIAPSQTSNHNLRVLDTCQKTFSPLETCALKSVEREILTRPHFISAQPVSFTPPRAFTLRQLPPWAQAWHQHLRKNTVAQAVLGGSASLLIGMMTGSALVKGAILVTGSSLLVFGIVAGATIGSALTLGLHAWTNTKALSLHVLGKVALQGALVGIVGGLIGFTFDHMASSHIHPTAVPVVMARALSAPVTQTQAAAMPVPAQSVQQQSAPLVSSRQIPPPPTPAQAQDWVQYQAMVTANHALPKQYQTPVMISNGINAR